MWIAYGLSAGFVLGLYDIWTKKGMTGNSVLAVVFWSSIFGLLCWIPLLITYPFVKFYSFNIVSIYEFFIVLPKSIAMTASWILAYFAIKKLPISMTGAIRTSGPVWTLIGGIAIFGESLNAHQYFGLSITILAYYVFTVVGKKENAFVARAPHMLGILSATLLSSLVTVYDKYLIFDLGMQSFDIQACSALQRTLIALGCLMLISPFDHKNIWLTQWSWSIPLMGAAWIAAEMIYFFAYSDPAASVALLSVFRRMSLIVGFVFSSIYLYEANLGLKALMIASLILGTAIMIIGR
jgi:bacterial/archaeal transporter family protein